MAVIDAIRRRLAPLIRSESGMALPTALFATIAAMALAGAAVTASTNVQRGTGHDSDSKRAIANADAAASVAMMRLNRYSDQLDGSNPCIGLSGETLVATGAAGDGWCPAVAWDEGGAAYSYRISPVSSECSGAGAGELCVVATGSSGGVTRRIEITFNATSGTSSSGKGSIEGLTGEDSITLSGNADIRVGVGTNGNLTTSGNTSICGDVRVGVGKEWQASGNTTQCPGHQVSEGNATLPPVSSFMPTDIAESNDDYRLVTCTKTTPTKVPAGCQSDGFNGTWGTNSPWNPSKRTLSLSGNSTLTLTGGDYWFCKLSFSGNSELIMGSGAHVRIFFDTPENCNGETHPISMSGNNRIASTSYLPSQSQFDVPGFYLLGSPTQATSVSLSGNSSTENQLVIYGPNTTINISGNATWKGVIAGKKISMSGNGTIKQDLGFEPPPEITPSEGVTLFQRQSYVECTGHSASPPNAGC